MSVTCMIMLSATPKPLYEKHHTTLGPTVVCFWCAERRSHNHFNLEQAFELGQIQIYENIEGLHEVEVTMEKVLDGYPLLYTSVTAGEMHRFLEITIL